MKDLTWMLIIGLLGIALMLGLQCVRLIDQRNADVVERYAPMMETLND